MFYNIDMAIRKVFKTGHSLAVTLSKKILDQLGLKVGDNVSLEIEGSKITIKKSGQKSQLSLDLPIRPKLGSKR
jgi:antitoxin component of MazEF toxin-antitoxin module